MQPGLIFLRVKKNSPEDIGLIADVTTRYPLTKIITLYEVAEENFVQQLFHQKCIRKGIPGSPGCGGSGWVVLLPADLKAVGVFSVLHQKKFTGALEPASFTPREKQIITLLCQECTAKEIADKLALSKRTIENMKMRIQEKMQAKNIAGIVSYAYRYSLVKNLF